MPHTTLDIIASDTPKDKELNTFQLLWNKIEKHELRNQKAEVKVNKLFDDYQNILSPYEKKLGMAHCSLVEHLISFMPKKDLDKQDKLNLIFYLDMQFDEMQQKSYLYDSEKVEELRQKVNEYEMKFFSKERKKEIETHYDYLKEDLNRTLGINLDLPDELLKEALINNDTDKLESLLQQVQQAYFENFSDKETMQDSEWQDFRFNYYQNEDDESSRVTEIFKASQLNKMYKKIANVIHPDKQADPLKQVQMQKQMQLLIAAKNEGDVFTLIKMYQEFVPDGSYILDDSTLEHIEHLLQMRIRKLNQAHRDIFNGQGMKSSIWKAYSAPSRKQSLEIMNESISIIKDQVIRIKTKINKLNTSKDVKEMLKELVG